MVMLTKFDQYTDEELIRMVDNSNNATELELALAERLDMRIRDIEEMNNEAKATYARTTSQR